MPRKYKLPKNMNEMACELCHLEKGKEEISVAQMKQVLKKLAWMLKRNPLEMMSLLLKYAGKQ